MTTVSHHAGVHAEDPTDRISWWILSFIGVAQFMVILDVTVVNIALPSISKGLNFSATDLQWVVTVYVLFTGGLMLLGGRSADLFGRRRMFLIGLLVFTAASLTSGLAWSPHALIVSRAAQGFGAALLLPSALAIITTTYSGASANSRPCCLGCDWQCRRRHRRPARRHHHDGIWLGVDLLHQRPDRACRRGRCRTTRARRALAPIGAA